MKVDAGHKKSWAVKVTVMSGKVIAELEKTAPSLEKPHKVKYRQVTFKSDAYKQEKVAKESAISPSSRENAPTRQEKVTIMSDVQVAKGLNAMVQYFRTGIRITCHVVASKGKLSQFL